jgi:hypothetical protein
VIRTLPEGSNVAVNNSRAVVIEPVAANVETPSKSSADDRYVPPPEPPARRT